VSPNPTRFRLLALPLTLSGMLSVTGCADTVQTLAVQPVKTERVRVDASLLRCAEPPDVWSAGTPSRDIAEGYVLQMEAAYWDCRMKIDTIRGLQTEEPAER